MKYLTLQNIQTDFERDSLVAEFLEDIIVSAMTEFNIDREDVYVLFTKMDFCDIDENDDLMYVGMHYGVDSVLNRMREVLRG